MMAAASGWTSHAYAVQSFTEDVLAVADALAVAGNVAAFTASLRELLELASSHRVLIADDDVDDALLVRSESGVFRLSVEGLYVT